MDRGKVLVVYHRVDYDGLFSGMITRKFLEDSGYNVTYFAYNYGEDLTQNPDDFDSVFLVDISLSPELMMRYSDKIIWIDHHITAIETSEENGYDKIRGIRTIGTAACELCWNYFYPNFQIPLIVSYIGAYDVWNKDKYDWENEVVPLQKALRATLGMSMDSFYPVFTADPNNMPLEDLFGVGRTIKSYEDYGSKSAVKNYGFPITVAGKYKGIAMLTHSFGSGIFSSVLNDYDIYVVLNKKNGQNGPQYTLSMYSEPGRVPEFNIGAYLKSFGLGGGGHATAGGSTITEDQFFAVIKDGKI